MKKYLILSLLIFALLPVWGWHFDGVKSRTVLTYTPTPGRFALTMAFRMSVPRRMLTPGYSKGAVFYPLMMQAVKPGKNDFSKIMLCFVTQPGNRYFFAAASPGGRYNINWSNSGSEIPTDKPVWVFLSAAAGGIFEARINKRNYSHIRGAGGMPLVQSAKTYRIYLGHNPYKGGVGFIECDIDDFMLFERVLSVEEMEMIEKNAAAGNTIPGKVELAL